MMERLNAAVNAHSWNTASWHDLKRRWNTAHGVALGHVAGTGRRSIPRSGTMRKTLLISVAALALAAGGNLAFSQGGGGGGGGGGAGGGGSGSSGRGGPPPASPSRGR